MIKIPSIERNNTILKFEPNLEITLGSLDEGVFSAHCELLKLTVLGPSPDECVMEICQEIISVWDEITSAPKWGLYEKEEQELMNALIDITTEIDNVV